MKIKIEKVVEEIVNDKIEAQGFEIEYIEFVKEGSQNILRIVIDRNEGTVSIDDCETISRSVEDDIDKHISQEYVLEVSSPGLERQLKTSRLYEKYLGSEVYIKLYKKNEYGKEFTGILESFDSESEKITLKCSEKNYEFFLKDIASAHTIYDFSSELGGKNDVNINKLKKF